MAGRGRDLWVFGYGSLMWQPGFSYLESHNARLTGYRRALCIYSVLYRGSPQRPGLVLGLDRGGACEGVAYRISAADASSVLAYLRERELVYGVYREAMLPVRLMTDERPEVMAVAYIAERKHPSYAGDLGLTRQARIVRGGSGTTGTNADYLFNTLGHLRELKIREPRLERLCAVMGAIVGRGELSQTGRPRAIALQRALRLVPAAARPQTKAGRNHFGYRHRMAEH